MEDEKEGAALVSEVHCIRRCLFEFFVDAKYPVFSGGTNELDSTGATAVDLVMVVV